MSAFIFIIYKSNYNFLHGNKYLIAQHQHQLGTRKHQLENMTSVLEGE